MQLLSDIRRTVLYRPLRTAIIDDQRSWPAWKLWMAAMRLAREIERASDRPHVGFMLPTSGLSPLALLAIWMLGRTAVPLNYLLKPAELAYVIDDAELDVVLTVRKMTEMFGDLPDGVRSIFLEEVNFGGFPTVRGAVRRCDDHVAVLLYTSGTSGKPKGVMLSAANLRSNIRQCTGFVEFTRHDSVLGVLPQFHSFGLTVLTLLPLSVGCPAIYTARFMPKRILELMQKHRPTVFIAIPSMYNALLAQKHATKDHFRSLRIVVSGGEPLPESVAEGFRERFGVTINEGYGLTETSPATNICRPGEYRAKSVGRALPGIEQRIVGPDGAVLGPDEDGEIRMRGPNIMQGYYKLPDETAEVFDEEGFFRTGDMGRIDKEGFLFITGRIKEMLIIAGENVFPREIEEVLNRHPSVHAAAVIGRADPSRGEVPVAFVEPAEGVTVDPSEVLRFAREHLARYKVPDEIRVVEALPRNPTGKIMRRELSI